MTERPLIRKALATVVPDFATAEVNVCQHPEVHEIGQDFDKDGRLLRLNRCQHCGLLMREYLPIKWR